MSASSSSEVPIPSYRPALALTARGLLALLLSVLTACGHAADLRYRVRAQPQSIQQASVPAAPAPAADELGRARRVVVDVAQGCRSALSAQRARCLRVEAAALRVLRDGGREAVPASSSDLDALALAQQVEADALVRIELSEITRSESQRTAPLELEDAERGDMRRAEPTCTPEVLAALSKRATHARAELGVRWVRSHDAHVLWQYRDGVQGEAATPAESVAAHYREQDASATQTSTNGSNNTYVYVEDDDDDDDDDDDEASAAGMVILSLLVVGLIVVAVAAARANDVGTCQVLDVPPLPSTAQHALDQRLDDLLFERLGKALGPLAPRQGSETTSPGA